MRKYLAIGLMLVGVLVLLVPVVGKWYVTYQQKQMYTAYLENMAQMETSTPQSEGDAQQVQVQTEQEGTQEVLTTPNGLEVIGQVAIPKIGVELMFVEGVTNQDLKFAVGHMPQTALPGEVGNCAIAGHRSYTFGEYFNRLDEVEIGDEIHVTFAGEKYTYKVYETFLVEPSEVSVLEPQGDRKVVTLITCHPVVAATHRLIVRGELVEK